MSDAQEKKIKKLQKNLEELNTLFTKNDEELRGKIRDIRIANMSGVVATEFTLANKLGITMDVVLSLLPEGSRSAVQAEIDRRVSEARTTVDIAKALADKLYKEDKDQ